MFMGEYQHSIDSKGRVIVPVKFRENLGERFVMTRGLDDCLFVYPLTEWAILEEKLRNLPLTQKDARAFTRFFFSGAVACELDKQGRVNIPLSLRTYAALDNKCAIIGVANRIELWSDTKWKDYLTDSTATFTEIAENLLDFNI